MSDQGIQFDNLLGDRFPSDFQSCCVQLTRKQYPMLGTTGRIIVSTFFFFLFIYFFTSVEVEQADKCTNIINTRGGKTWFDSFAIYRGQKQESGRRGGNGWVRGNEEKRRWMFTSVLRGAILLSRRGCNGDAWKSG